MKGTVKFENLKGLLKSKQFNFDYDDLETIIRLRHSTLTYKEVKAEVLANSPINAEEMPSKLSYIILLQHKRINDSSNIGGYIQL